MSSTTVTLTASTSAPRTTLLSTQPPPPPPPPPTTMSSSTPAPAPPQCCPNCGFGITISSPSLEEAESALAQAQHQIDDLQAQVLILNQKASAAVDRWADYEDELARLRSQLNEQSRQSTSTNTTASSASPGRSSFLPTNRISALLSPRKPLPATPPPAPQRQTPNQAPNGHQASQSISQQPPTTPDNKAHNDLLSALSREQFLRREAEGRLSETSREVEELSVSLFEQANEMVATERRQRAELEEKLEALERRERDKMGRLARLEACAERIVRTRDVLGETEEMMKAEAARGRGLRDGMENGRR